MIGFREFLTESRSAPLYHGTFGDAVYNILLHNGIEPKTFHQNWKLGYPDKISDHSKNYSIQKNTATVLPFSGLISGVSLTRSFKFAVSYGSGYVLEIDQRRLAQKYKIIPFQFWQDHSRTTGARSAWPNEFEEFVVTNQPIPPKYITRLYYPKMWHDRFDSNNPEFKFIEAIQQKYGSEFIRTY